MIHLIATGRALHVTATEPITTGSVGMPVEVELTSDFDGLAVTVCFDAGGAKADVVYLGDPVTVPPQCLIVEGVPLRIGVRGALPDGTIVIPTVWATVANVRRGVMPSGVNPAQPEPDWTAQVQRAAQEAKDTAEQLAEDARTWADAETARATAETARADAEAARRSAEQARTTAEGQRVSAEATRASNEATRTTAELARSSAEQARATAEGQRASEWATIRQDATSATQAAATAGERANTAASAASAAASDANAAVTSANAAATSASNAADDATAAAAEARAVLVYDEAAGEYTSQSLAAWLAVRRDSLAYGVSIPKGSATDCTKVAANATIPDPTPGIVGRAAVDPYAGLGPFFHMGVNGFVDSDGYPHVTAVEGDGRFERDGSNGNVWVLAPVLYWRIDESGESAVVLSVSDTPLAGMEPQPYAMLPDGSMRPFMLYAKYVGVLGDDGKMASVSGRKPWNRNISHNSLIAQCATASTGYSGKSIGDDWYVKTMFLLKYATKNSQSIFYGANNYNVQVAPAVAETGVTRVIVPNASAANLMVGAAMMLGTHTAGSSDRNAATCFDVFDGLRIIRMEAYDSTNTAIYFDTATTFNVETSYLLSTSPWFSGCLDAVEGDGTLTDAGRLNGHEPFKLQGIECQMGVLEVLGDVILHSDGSTGWEICVNYDSRNEAATVTGNYSRTGRHLPSGSANAYHYPMHPVSVGGLLCGVDDGASTSTGLCDSTYTNSTSAVGDREWLGGGFLHYGANAGLWCVHGLNGLGYTGWYFGSRLSVVGRSRAAA